MSRRINRGKRKTGVRWGREWGTSMYVCILGMCCTRDPPFSALNFCSGAHHFSQMIQISNLLPLQPAILLFFLLSRSRRCHFRNFSTVSSGDPLVHRSCPQPAPRLTARSSRSGLARPFFTLPLAHTYQKFGVSTPPPPPPQVPTTSMQIPSISIMLRSLKYWKITT